jgi:hypothetical protein
MLTAQALKNAVEKGCEPGRQAEMRLLRKANRLPGIKSLNNE